ncbi:MAG: histidine phosphatase family protein [Verrucomicrobia bacterium]|nr:histidine phosphatase family protein [Verrucomicrobiota bacterium]
MGEIHLVRHGQASFDSAEYDELSPLGHEQARLLGAWWRDQGPVPDRVLHGGMRRHRQTAVGFLEGMGLGHRAAEALVDESLNEFDHVEVVSRLQPDLTDHHAIARFIAAAPDPAITFHRLFSEGVARWTSRRFDAEYREPWPAFRERCQAALTRAIEATPSGSVTMVFTSGGPISVLLHGVLGMGEENLFDRSLLHANTGLTRLELLDGRLVPGAINETAHLVAAGREDLLTYR